jgi:hypothetical protein
MKILVLWFFLLFSLQADETLTGLFTQLKTVNKEDKFKVVNEIKKHIIALKQQARIDAIKILKAKKEAEKKLANQDVLAEPMLNHSDGQTKEEHMAEHMDEMKEMNIPSKMSDMKQMPKMQNMSTMRNTPLIKEMQERMRENTGQIPSSEMRRKLMGNR